MKVYEFSDHHAFLQAAQRSASAQQLVEAYSFLPEDEVSQWLPLKHRWIPRATVAGAMFGSVGAFLLQYWPNVWGYSMNVAGKPLNSWPAFLLVCFEMAVLFAAFSGVAVFFLVNKYPRFDRAIFALSAYQANRHQHYFIVTTREDHHDKALAVHDLPDAP